MFLARVARSHNINDEGFAMSSLSINSFTSRTRDGAWAVAIGFALLAQSSFAVSGQPGTLDASFGTGGKVMTSFGAANDRATAVALQPDGKIVVAGYCRNSSQDDFCALRYEADGTLDQSFGSAGKAINAVGIDNDSVVAVALQPDSKIVVVGFCLNSSNLTDFCALRHNADGSVDTDFGSGGKVIASLSSRAIATSLVLQPDGKLVLAGYCGVINSYDFCAVRLNADGSRDNSFGGGTVVKAIGSGDDRATAIALQPDGKLVLAGYCGGSSTSYDFCALRLNADGTTDLTFSGGTVITPIGAGTSFDQVNAIALQPDGKLVLAGWCQGGLLDFCALRYEANGALDASFGSGGKVITAVGTGNDQANALALQSDGKLVLIGWCDGSGGKDFCAVRLHSDGSLDQSFGSGGKVITPVGAGTDRADAIAIQTDGKLVLAGACSNGSSDDFCVIRYDGGPFAARDCSPDFDGDGKVLATTDALMLARVAIGMTGNAVVNGINFAPSASRKTWPDVRNYLITQCGMSLQ
jgi:uncharacterized delta-60 repeat protein